ncbi:MAG: M28 family peptidase, partial [Myxococcales bacterium]|nr:M28 family peptidase [Myxococcales bacterium]
MTHTRWLLVLGAATAGLVLGLRFTACAPMPPGALHPPPAELREGASGARLEADVRHLFELGPRGQAHPQAMREAADWIEARLGAGGVPTSRQAVPVGSPSFENIIATVGESSDPQGAPRAPIVVGAHYDSWMDTAGADDNASGVAGLLELIRMLRALDSPPFVLLIAFATEEPPHFRSAAMGSAVHAQHAHERGAPIAFMISLEMLGYFRDDPGSQLYPSAHLRYRMPDRGDYIAIVGREEDEALVNALRDAMSVHARMPVYGYAAPSFVEGIDFSDHRSYWA